MTARSSRLLELWRHLRFVAMWAVVTAGACCVLQFREVSYLPFFFQFLLVIWWMLPPILAIDAAIVATRGTSWSAGLRSLAESVVLVVATFAAMAAIRATCRSLGAGMWPPRNGALAQRLRDQRAGWDVVLEGVLGDARAIGATLSRDVVNQLDPDRVGVRYDWDERFRELGVFEARAAWDGRWLRLTLWKGTEDSAPVGEKGLLYVTPGLAGEPEMRWVRQIAVEDLGDGWYVYEE